MEELKIISSNIRFENPEDGANDWPHRKGLLSKIINDFDTDILVTQEGRKPQLLELENLIPNLKLIDSHREWISHRMYPCIFINPDKIQVINSGDIWLSKTPYENGSSSFDSAFPRLCSWASIKVLKSKKGFMIINLHLDHVKAQTRSSQIKVCLKEIDKINSKNLPYILAGDFNESPFEDVRSIINSSWTQLIDPWQILKKAETSSHHKFNDNLKSGNRIDWILTDKNEFDIIDISFDEASENGVYPSDHLPLKLSLK